MRNAEIPGLMLPQVHIMSFQDPSIVIPDFICNLEGSHMEMVWSLQNFCHFTDIMAIQCEQQSGIK